MGVFDGVKILQFAWVAAGPLSIQPLADQGATVVKVESQERLDPARLMAPFKDGIPGVERSGLFASIERNRFSLALDLQHPRSRDVTRRLVKWADIVVENFRPGTMDEMGLGYEETRILRPDIIYVHASIQGQTGPHCRQPGFGIFATALGGITALTGWPDRAPVLPFDGYVDFILPRFASVVTMAALDYRRRTGKGQEIDIAQLESAMQFIAPVLLDYSVNAKDQERMGNACAHAAPHGVYPCLGEDRWVAITVSSDEEWASFCKACGHGEWFTDSRFATLLSRKHHEAELDQLVAGWTVNLTNQEVMLQIQDNGIPAGMVEDGHDMLNDPQLRNRPAFWWKEHPVLGEMVHCAELFRLSDDCEEARRAAPVLGEHTELVCTRFLGMSKEEFIDLRSTGVFV